MISFNGTNITNMTFNGTTVEKATFNGVQVYPPECSYVCFNEMPYICINYSDCKHCNFEIHFPSLTSCVRDNPDETLKLVVLYGGALCQEAYGLSGGNCVTNKAVAWCCYNCFDVLSTDIPAGTSTNITLCSSRIVKTSFTYRCDGVCKCDYSLVIPTIGVLLVRSDGKMGVVTDAWIGSGVNNGAASGIYGTYIINCHCGEGFIRNGCCFCPPICMKATINGCANIDSLLIHDDHCRYNSCVSLC